MKKTVDLKKLVIFLDAYLDKSISDASFNGLQFEGTDKVSKVMFAVDSGIDTFKEAIRQKADMLVVHHGLFWSGIDPSINGVLKKRIALLFDNDISLYVSHLPLDRHEIVGNNAQILKSIGAKITEGCYISDGVNIGWTGTLKNIARDKILKMFTEKFGKKVLPLFFGKKNISTVSALSGAAGRRVLDIGSDLIITGEQSDFYNDAKDLGKNIIFLGHHASETYGVKALSELVAKQFLVETVFVDLPTGL